MADVAVKSKAGAGPFSAFERLVAWRYLRSRRKEAFISVIAAISFAGIMLGVATLIVVMAVMNGFRAELLVRILGINGHIVMTPVDSPLDDYEEIAGRISGIKGVRYAIPLIDGQVLASGRTTSGTGALVRGIGGDDLGKLDLVRNNIQAGHHRRLRCQRRRRHRHAHGRESRAGAGRPDHAGLARRRRDAARHDAQGQGLSDRRHLRDRHVRI